MSGFAALNLEPDEESDEEIDDTRELQIEEALKLYSSAIKLHSQGPISYDSAQEAYDALFRSDIFQYQEAVSLHDDQDLQADLPLYTTSDGTSVQKSRPLVGNNSDSTPNTLPQILYLSHKNYGEFLVDILKHKYTGDVIHSASSESQSAVLKQEITLSLRAALERFAQALYQDETDLELWRKASTIGNLIDSIRIVRFCLESVTDGAESDLDATIEPLRLEEGFAIEELKQLLTDISDYLSASDPAFLELGSKHLSAFLRRRIDSYPQLSFIKDILKPSRTLRMLKDSHSTKVNINVAAPTWAAVGKAIVQYLNAEEQGLIHPEPGAGIVLNVPDQTWSSIATQQVVSDRQRDTKHHGGDGSNTNWEQPNGQAKHSDNENAIDDKVTSEGHTETANDGPKDSSSRSHEFSPPAFSGRKRSSTSAGMDESAEGGRGRSKRLRARESLAEAGLIETITANADSVRQKEENLKYYLNIDSDVFQAVGGLLETFGVKGLGTSEGLHEAVGDACWKFLDHSKSAESTTPADTTVKDLRKILTQWEDMKGNAFLYGGGADDPGAGISGGPSAGLAAFLVHSKTTTSAAAQKPLLETKDEFKDFIQKSNDDWTTIQGLSVRWLEALLLKGSMNETIGSLGSGSTYTEYLWSESLKEAVVQVLVKLDDAIFTKLNAELNYTRRLLLEVPPEKTANGKFLLMDALTEMIQTVFELQLDIYASITNPSSEVDLSTRITQSDRLRRWASLTTQAITIRMHNSSPELMTDIVTVRYLWASSYNVTLMDGVSREHALLCIKNLKSWLQENDTPTFPLQNNAVMPEISVAAAEREISRLTTMDFFVSIFSPSEEDPLGVIEKLEPLLEPSAGVGCRSQRPSDGQDAEMDDNDTYREDTGIRLDSNVNNSPTSSQPQMSTFLEKSSATLRLFLWNKLTEAYMSLPYFPKVVACHLHSIGLVMDELESTTYIDDSEQHRHFSLLKWMRVLDDILSKLFPYVLEETDSFDCIPYEHIVSSLNAVSKLVRLLYSVNLFHDDVRAGEIQAAKSSDHNQTSTFGQVCLRLGEMQVRAWLLLYVLLKEGMSQSKELFPDFQGDCVRFLRSVHYGLGVRFLCKVSNKIFLKLMRKEIVPICDSLELETDVAQVLYDLHGLKLFPNNLDMQDHDCSPDPLDRQTALEIMDLVLHQVHRVGLKDVPKTDIRSTIERMQQVLGAPKQTSSMQHNTRVINAYMKSSVRPMDLFNCLKGIGDLSTLPVTTESGSVAAKGWYFLLGMVALTRFRSQKRVSAGPTEDLDIAASFFRQDLQYNIEKWETWYRLAQVYDIKLEEDVLWSAEKLDKNRQELKDLQRRSVHCYMMAVAHVLRFGELTSENTNLLSDLYMNFGVRIYASSRAPFSMEAFWLDDFVRPYSGVEGMYKSRPHPQLTEHSAWKFASVLFSRAIEENPSNWMSHYMLGKCLWKICTNRSTPPAIQSLPHFDDAIDCFQRAIHALPDRRDTRQEPILEPHYKLVSIVHKLVQSKHIDPLKGGDLLNVSHYAQKIPSPSDDIDQWESYILQVLKTLRTADKANWHHRMIARAAHVIYDESEGDMMAAMGAKHEFTQQIFTKTMSLQVWKPEHERAGRHYVYTTTYVLFFVQLLSQLNDRSSMEALVKRVRKRTGEFFKHTLVWQELCLAYIRILRRAAQVAEGHEEVIFRAISHDDFQKFPERLETWSHSPLSSSLILDVLKEAVELKKLNAGLMKPSIIEDLVADCYAKLYESVVPELKGSDETRSSIEPTPLLAPTTTERRSDMMNVNNLLMTMDGTNDPATQPGVEQSLPGGQIVDLGLATARARPKVITRRELQRKADAILMKPAVPIAPKATTGRSGGSALVSQQSNPYVQSDEGQDEHATNLSKDDKDPEDLPIDSAQGSVHDSADDESELSEPEDDEEETEMVDDGNASPKPNFPESSNGNPDEAIS